MTADSHQQSSGGASPFLSGGGRAGALMRSLDWSRSPLGAPETWPQSLRTVASLLLNSRFAMFVAWGTELGFLYNDAYADILGEKHPSAMGQPFRDIWSEIWSDILPLVEAALCGEATYSENLPLMMHRFGYGEAAWFTFSYSPVHDENGSVCGMFCAVAETTSQVRADRRQAFRLTFEESLRDLVDPVEVMAAAAGAIGRELQVGRVGYGEVDADGEYVAIARDWTDDRMAPIAGRFRLDDFGPAMIGELRDGRHVAIADVQDDPRTGQASAAFATIATRGLLAVPLIKAGRLTSILYLHHLEPRRWRDDDIALVAEVAERTWAAVERARAQAALAEANAHLEARVAERTSALTTSEQRFRAIFDTTFQLTGLAKLDGTLVLVNQATLDAIRIPLHRVKGRMVWDAPWWAAAPEEQLRVREAVTRAARGQFVRYEAQVQLPIGRRTLDVSLKPILDERGYPAFLLAEARDITDHKLAEEALRQSQKMEAVGQLTGGIAHDFNNLLGAVVGSLDLIRRHAKGDERLRRFAETGLHAAERGAKLTGQLLTFSRAQRIETHPMIVADVIAGMRELLARTIGPMVQLTFDLDDDRLPVLSDPTQLEMAVLNLAINARDALESGETQGGNLTIATHVRDIANDPELEPGVYVEIAVTDDGQGMTPEVLSRAIDPFFTTKGVGKGTGLGLSQVYGIAHQGGGALRIDSRPGGGTTVRILLPVTAQAVATVLPAAVPAAKASDTPASILVIDDDPDVRLMLVDILNVIGYRVTSAADGPSGLAMLEDAAPDLLLIDFAMPGMNGAEVARVARSRRPDLPILFASGYSDTAMIESVLGPEAVVLRKPFLIEDLQSAMREALGR